MFENPFRKKTKEEVFLDGLPIRPELRAETKSAFSRVAKNDYYDVADKRKDLEIVRDTVLLGLSAVSEKKSYASGFSMYGGNPGNSAGYSPGGSILKKIFPSDFLRQAFLAEAYYACRKARNELIVETARDGYALVADSKVPKKTIKMIDGVLRDLGVPKKRISMKDTLMWCGNVAMNNSYNKFGGLLKLNPLLMARINPIFDVFGYELIGWEMDTGRGKPVFIPYEESQHIKTFNARSNVLGMSCLAALEVDIEAALQAAIYNNNVMSKGGLLSIVFRMKSPNQGAIVNDKQSWSIADELTKWFERRFGGIRGGGQLAFIPDIDGVENLNKIGEMDSAFQYLDRSTASKVAIAFGLSPERIGLPKTSQYQNKEMVNDNISLSLDNNVYYYQAEIDNYITEEVIKNGMGIDNVVLESSGEYSSVSKSVAEFGELIANMGADVMRVDTYLTKYLHADPLGGEEGQKFLGEFLRIPKTTGGPVSNNPKAEVLGPFKDLVPGYKEYRAELIRHTQKNIRFY